MIELAKSLQCPLQPSCGQLTEDRWGPSSSVSCGRVPGGRPGKRDDLEAARGAAVAEPCANVVGTRLQRSGP
jgi:hypothetical protein